MEVHKSETSTVAVKEETKEDGASLTRSFDPVRGLLGLGNTCFMNATLQALFNSKRFVNKLLSHETHSECENYGSCMVCRLYEQYKICKYTRFPYIIYRALPVILKDHSFSFKQRLCYDPYDFLMGLLNSMSKDFKRSLFEFKVRKTTTCLNCGEIVEKTKFFDHLSLYVDDKKSVEQAVGGFFKNAADIKYYCLKCSKSVSVSFCVNGFGFTSLTQVNAKTTIRFEEYPSVLVIRLKRFLEERKLRYIIRRVEVAKGLKIHKFAESEKEGKEAVAKLRGVVIHSGANSLVSGANYYCYLIRNGEWYKVDNSYPSKTTWERIVEDMSNNGYLILYDICKQANAHLKKRKAKEVLERKTAYTVAPERNTFERDRLRDILLSKDNKEKSWIMIQIAVNCFKPSTSIRSRKSSPNESYNINRLVLFVRKWVFPNKVSRARFLRDSLKTVCPSLKVNTNRSADWPIVKSQNSFFNKICNVVETIQKYGTLIVKYNSPDDPFLLNGVEDDIQTRIYADVFKEGFSESLRKYLDPGTSENKDSPMVSIIPLA